MYDQHSTPGLSVSGGPHAVLAASASTSAPSLRHRSSTLKPAKKPLPPPRLDLPKPSSNRPPSSRPSSPLPRVKSPTLPSTLHTNGLATATARPPSPVPTPSHAPTPATPNHPTGIRAHFAQLLPRHAVFLARITIHQLNSVPLVRGEFGVRWKVKGVTNGGLLGKVKGKAKGKGKAGSVKTAASMSSAHDSLKSRARAGESDVDNASLLDASASISDTHSIAASSSTHSHSHDRGSPASLARSQPLGHPQAPPRNIPAVVVSSNSPNTPSPPITRNVSGTSIVSMPSSASHSTRPHLQHYLSAGWYPQAVAYSPTVSMASSNDPPQSHVPALADTPPADGYTPAKGQTPFEALKDHNVVWEQTLDFVVQMGVGRESGELGECPAKLTVMQRVIPGDLDAPRNPRVGTVYLNLAQYVGAGVVTRRYLLRQSKTNATLKLTVQLEHSGGSSSYLAPPLPKAEILSGVTGLLESDTYLNRPRTVGLYSSSSGSSDSLSSVSLDSSSHVLPHMHIQPDKGHTNQPKVHGGRRRKKSHKRKPFDPLKLPDVRGPRATERLIEAIFNPAPVTLPGQVNPFTYLVERYDEQDVAYEGGDQASLDRERGVGARSALGGAVDDPYFYVGASLEGEGEGYAPESGQNADHQDSDSDYQSIRSERSVPVDSDHPLK
ncbi:hypothetical protein ID866_8485, partial [Astraeus odoratus]